MTINMKRAVRRQTVNHFIYTFMKDYDTEKAADRTMKSKYVPHNLKTQLITAMSQCNATDHSRIERVARLGMFIDSSCNELVYYNTITTAVMRWTISFYVDSADIKRIFEIVMEDAGRICDDDIHFIMEKYRYLEESGGIAGRESGEGSIIGFLKARKHSPDTSLIWYYGNCLWLKIMRAALRNSMNMFNSNSFSSIFANFIDPEAEVNVGGVNGDAENSKNKSNGLDKEAQALYKEFQENRTEWLKAITRSNKEKIENSVTYEDTTSSENEQGSNRNKIFVRPTKNRESRSKPPRPPPNVSVTAFDVPFDDYDDWDGQIDIVKGKEYSSNDSDGSEAETVLRVPYTYDKKFTQNQVKEPYSYGQSEVNVHQPGANTMVLARITQEKKLHILDNNLKNILMEEKTSKALSTQTDDPNGTGSITTVETVFTKRTRETSHHEGLAIMPLELSSVRSKPRIQGHGYKSTRNEFEPSSENACFSGLRALPASPILRALPAPEPVILTEEEANENYGDEYTSLFC